MAGMPSTRPWTAARVPRSEGQKRHDKAPDARAGNQSEHIQRQRPAALRGIEVKQAEHGEANSVAGEREKEQRQNRLHAGEHRGIDEHGGGNTRQQGRAANDEDQDGDGREESAVKKEPLLPDRVPDRLIEDSAADRAHYANGDGRQHHRPTEAWCHPAPGELDCHRLPSERFDKYIQATVNTRLGWPGYNTRIQ